MNILGSNNSKKPKKSRAQQILDDIEGKLRELIKEKKQIWKEFTEKSRELEVLRTQFQKNLVEAEKLEHEFILLWDYWYREVEILQLDKKIQAGVLPDEREVIMKKQLKLTEHNKTIAKGFREREISADIMAEIKKRLGIWEGKEEKIK